MKKNIDISSIAMSLLLLLSFQLSAQGVFDGKIGKTIAESIPGKAPVRPNAKGKPNVLWIMIDDAGYGSCSAFGGGPNTPVLDNLVKTGITYTNFHTTGVCTTNFSEHGWQGR